MRTNEWSRGFYFLSPLFPISFPPLFRPHIAIGIFCLCLVTLSALNMISWLSLVGSSVIFRSILHSNGHKPFNNTELNVTLNFFFGRANRSHIKGKNSAIIRLSLSHTLKTESKSIFRNHLLPLSESSNLYPFF